MARWRRSSSTVALSASKVTVAVPRRRLFNGVDLQIRRGECVAVAGRSGSGKTTLLHCLAGITTPQSGKVLLGGEEFSELRPAQRGAVRLRRIGMVFQFGYLVPELTVIENVELPLRLTGVRREHARARARDCLEAAELTGHNDAFPETLSGGETQRAAVARAISSNPDVIIADEPTGSLDEKGAELITDLLIRLTVERNLATVVATHDPAVITRATRVLHVRNESLTAGS